MIHVPRQLHFSPRLRHCFFLFWILAIVPSGEMSEPFIRSAQADDQTATTDSKKTTAKKGGTKSSEGKGARSKSSARSKDGNSASEKSNRVKPGPTKSSDLPDGIGRYTSKHFLLFTDTSSEAADDLLKRLETMLTLISKYWGRPASGVIEMYVVEDLSKWPADSLAPEGLAMIQAGAGVTVGKTISDGTSFIAKSVVYAVADRGTPQHEAVHAYCIQTFGRVGPVWYAEGMAEMGQYWRGEDRAVFANPGVIEYLKRSRPLEFTEIVNEHQRTGDSWQNYAWRWALCHLLAHNPNYSPRFRPLGVALLTGQKTNFYAVYGGMKEEIIFEYQQFLSQLETGLRVDLTAWDWKAKFKTLNGDTPIQVKIASNRGWQPARLQSASGKSYRIESNGTWKLGPDDDEVSADGDSAGAGRLEGVFLYHDDDGYRLGAPFAIGSRKVINGDGTAKLYLRCRDAWGTLADNEGTISVKIYLEKSDET